MMLCFTYFCSCFGQFHLDSVQDHILLNGKVKTLSKTRQRREVSTGVQMEYVMSIKMKNCRKQIIEIYHTKYSIAKSLFKW